MGKFIQIKAIDGFEVPAYTATPQNKPTAAVVVLQEIFGVNSHIRAVTDRFASHGYLAIAPATFERVQRGVDLDYSEADMGTGIGLKTAVDALPGGGVLQDVQAAIDYATRASGGRVGVIGFCWGGLLAWRAACQLKGLSAAVSYYGGGITSEEEIARNPQCPVMAHFGVQDHWIPMDSVEAFKKAHSEVDVHVYDANHGFNCDQRGSYNAAAANTAEDRTLKFFANKLV